MRPYYQDSENDNMLQQYLTDYKTPESAASMLWGELPAVINSGAIKAYNTGASSTTFNTPSEIAAFCNERSKYFASRARGKDFSLFVKVERDDMIGGAVE